MLYQLTTKPVQSLQQVVMRGQRHTFLSYGIQTRKQRNNACSSALSEARCAVCGSIVWAPSDGLEVPSSNPKS